MHVLDVSNRVLFSCTFYCKTSFFKIVCVEGYLCSQKRESASLELTFQLALRRCLSELEARSQTQVVCKSSEHC